MIDLPQGATPLDFAYYIHTEVGNRCRGAKVNGRIVSLTYMLQSGEQVEILTGREARPSRDWLNPQLGFLRTSRAKTKVRSWFNQLDQAQHLQDGRQIFDRELHRLGARDLSHQLVVDELKLESFDELLILLGRGSLNTAQLASALERLTCSHSLLNLPHRESSRSAHKDSDRSPVLIQGVGNLLTQMANCCQPTQGDAIIGYITLGRGVTIHRCDCTNILNLPEDKCSRLIEVEWSCESDETFPVDIDLEAYDRKGLLMDIYSLLSANRVNVISSHTLSDKSNHTALIQITIEVKNIDQLSLVLNRLNQLPNVFDARRRL